jgi:hypothetical protein
VLWSSAALTSRSSPRNGERAINRRRRKAPQKLVVFDVVNAVYRARLINGRRLTNAEKSVLARIADLVKGQLEQDGLDRRVASVSISQLCGDLSLRRERAHGLVKGLLVLGCLVLVSKGRGRSASKYHVPLAVINGGRSVPAEGTLPANAGVPIESGSVPVEGRSVPAEGNDPRSSHTFPNERRAHPRPTLRQEAADPARRNRRKPGQTGAAMPGTFDHLTNRGGDRVAR